MLKVTVEILELEAQEEMMEIWVSTAFQEARV